MRPKWVPSMVWCTIGGHLWQFGNFSSFKHKSSFTTVSLVTRFNCQVQKPSSYPLKLVVRRCQYWQSFDRRGRAAGMQIPLVLESCWAARRPKWTGAHLLFLSIIVCEVRVQNSGSQISLRLCSSCFTRGRENVSAVISESEQCPHRVGDLWSPVERLRS